MIKFIMDKDGQKVLGLGLSHQNLKHLKNGKPIEIDLKKIGHTNNDTIYLFAGRTEQSMTKDLKNFIGPETVVNET